jgi:hypothetical protein
MKLKNLAKRIFREHGDALEAEKIIAQARFIGRTYVIPGSSRHQIQQLPLKGNVLCVIDKPFRVTEKGMHLVNRE